ncbi:MAG: Rne/Rng family ribonuclease [Rhizomicrobium sp.]
MQKEILINAGAGEIRVAVLENGRLEELLLERTIGRGEEGARKRAGGLGSRSLVGNVYLGRVRRVLAGMQAAFVDIGLDRAGFLGAREARSLAGAAVADTPAAACANGARDLLSAHPTELGAEDRAPRIGDCVREGEDIVVQVVKDPIAEKGARLSANLSLPGRLLVLLPNQPGIALSRRIEDEAERLRLCEMCERMLRESEGALAPHAGFIVRSSAVGAELADLRADAERLSDAWLAAMEKREGAAAPQLLRRELDPVERIMRDECDADTTRVIVDDAEALAAARAYCRRAMPEADNRIARYDGPGLLFDLYEIEQEISALLSPRVPLPSGGWITIEGTEGLTAIDVNSGSFTDGAGPEETSFRVNLEAAAEIGRQLRLRGIGGLIVIDFIHTAEPAHSQSVLEALALSLARDRTPTQILPMSEFGLVEVTRKRIRDPLARQLTESCRPCTGRGRMPSCETVALDILRGVEREARHAPGHPIFVRAAPEVVEWIESRGEELRGELARRGVARVSFEARDEFAREGFDVAVQG